MKIFLVALMLSAIAVSADQNVPIQKQYDGLTIGNPTANFHLEAVIDLMCPDCAAATTILNAVLNKINFFQQNQMYITYHIFPLPFHYTSYMFSIAQHYVLTNFGADAALQFQDAIFENQAPFVNNMTNDKSTDQIYHLIASFTASTLSDYFVNENEVYAALNNRTYDLAARASWKYGVERVVTDTPTFWANGVLINGAPTFTEAQWLSFFETYTGLKPVAAEEKASPKIRRQVDAQAE